MKKQKPKELLERLPFPNYIPRNCFYNILSEEDQKKNVLDVQKHNHEVLGSIVEGAYNKMFVLLDYYEIDKNDDAKWFKLAFKLAATHEPGFQMQESLSGRTNVWDTNQLLGLYSLVELIKEERKIRTSDACKIIKKDYLSHSKISLKTLANKYSLAKKDHVAMRLYGIALSIDRRFNRNDARWKVIEESFDSSII
ncbi:hypothetical protein LIS44_01030 [Acinetobacter haemolyticus]|nr:hypothetical protein LIS44_01030 [Acinetobacter haemolyticus]